MQTHHKQPMRGVNLGGWLVLEKWITPSLFKDTSATDEYTFCAQAGATHLERLKNFRDTFITKKDFEWLAAHNIRVVRLPIGYWLFGAEPYQPTVQYVDQAFAWALQTGIKILLDLHGAPDSQNGYDHSGRIGKANWHRNPTNIAKTLEIIQRLAERYGKHPALQGMSLLNEPSPFIPKRVLVTFYRQAYGIIRQACGDAPWVVYSDGAIPVRWRRILPRSQFKNVYIDTHQYHVFSPLDKLLPLAVTWLRVRWMVPLSLRLMRRHHPVIVGEWSLALPHKPATQARHQAYAALQLQAYRHTDAWFFWTYRTEGGGSWSLRDSSTYL